jgi:lipoprotein NlpD
LIKRCIILWLLLALLGCSHGHAKVEHGIAWSNYTIQAGDTLYGVARRYEIDAQILAGRNALLSPYQLLVGQVLQVPTQPLRGGILLGDPSSEAKTPHHQDQFDALVAQLLATGKVLHAQARGVPNHTATKKVTLKPIVNSTKRHPEDWSKKNWLYPVRGHISHYFSTQMGKSHGINIVGEKNNEAIVASQGGTVAYVGPGGRGYGTLIMIRHGVHYLSVYAYNQQALVKEGAKVHAGQKIAIMGVGDKGKPMVHFEIRKDGKPLNPMAYIRT